MLEQGNDLLLVGTVPPVPPKSRSSSPFPSSRLSFDSDIFYNRRLLIPK